MNSGTSWIAASVLPDSSFLVPTSTISSCATSTTSRSFSIRLPSGATSVKIRSLPARPTWVTRVSPSGRVGSSRLTVLKLIASSTTSRLGWVKLNSLTPSVGRFECFASSFGAAWSWLIEARAACKALSTASWVLASSIAARACSDNSTSFFLASLSLPSSLLLFWIASAKLAIALS